MVIPRSQVSGQPTYGNGVPCVVVQINQNHSISEPNHKLRVIGLRRPEGYDFGFILRYRLKQQANKGPNRFSQELQLYY